MPIGLKVSDAIAAQGGEAVSLACTQAMVDGHTKSQQTSTPTVCQFPSHLTFLTAMRALSTRIPSNSHSFSL